jgi:3-oxoacyl-[acyl-carrier protein] reductase
MTLAGKVALVTGASRGLGLEIAQTFAAARAELALAARHPFDFAGDKVTTHIVDLGQLHEVDALVEDVVASHGGIDILVNNAAIQTPIGPLVDADFDAWRRTFVIDFLAPARLCQLVVRSMRSRGEGGKIINLSGGGAANGRPNFSAYACAKTALVRLTETLAEELKPHRIDVNAVAPGPMNTQMLQDVLQAGPAAGAKEYETAVARAEKGGASLANAAELILMLASPESDGITGRLISAVWDDWRSLPSRREQLDADVFTLRRIT